MRKPLTAAILALTLSFVTMSVFAISRDEVIQIYNKSKAGDIDAIDALKRAADQSNALAQDGF